MKGGKIERRFRFVTLQTHLVHLSTQSAHHVEGGAHKQRRHGRLLAKQRRDGEEQRRREGQPLAGIGRLSPTHVPQIAEVGEQVAHAGGNIRTPHHTCHGLRVNGMHCEERPCGQHSPEGGKQRASHTHHQRRRHAVQQIVDQVETPWHITAGHQVIQSEAQHAQWPPRAV